jgi:hypothetical protein
MRRLDMIVETGIYRNCDVVWIGEMRTFGHESLHGQFENSYSAVNQYHLLSDWVHITET